jgi:hypothetical protein
MLKLPMRAAVTDISGKAQPAGGKATRRYDESGGERS